MWEMYVRYLTNFVSLYCLFIIFTIYAFKEIHFICFNLLNTFFISLDFDETYSSAYSYFIFLI